MSASMAVKMHYLNLFYQIPLVVYENSLVYGFTKHISAEKLYKKGTVFSGRHQEPEFTFSAGQFRTFLVT